MANDKFIPCLPNADAHHGALKHRMCGPWCPHYQQSKEFAETISLKNPRVRQAAQNTARTGGRFPNCPNPRLK